MGGNFEAKIQKLLSKNPVEFSFPPFPFQPQLTPTVAEGKQQIAPPVVLTDQMMEALDLAWILNYLLGYFPLLCESSGTC